MNQSQVEVNTSHPPVPMQQREEMRKKYQDFEACNALNKRAMQHFESEYGPFHICSGSTL